MRLLFVSLFLLALTLAPEMAAAKIIHVTPTKVTTKQKRDPILGLWYTADRDGVVELYPCDGKICGRFHWLKENTKQDPSLDNKNPDEEKRSRPLCGMQFMGGFTPKGDKSYEDGWIYSPRHGAMFSASMKLVEKDRLDLHGYMFLPLLGESQVWERAIKPPACKKTKAD